MAAAAAVMVLLASALDPHPLVPENPAFRSPLAPPASLDGALTVVGGACLLVVLLALVVAAASLVLRFRRARGVERLQLRWLAVGAAANSARPACGRLRTPGGHAARGRCGGRRLVSDRQAAKTPDKTSPELANFLSAACVRRRFESKQPSGLTRVEPL